MRYTCVLVILAGLLTSCATHFRGLRLGSQPPGLSDMAFVTPISYIVLTGGPQAYLDTTATTTSAHLVHELLVRHQLQLRLRNEIIPPKVLQRSISQEVFSAIDGITEHQRLANRALLPVLHRLAATQPQRYLLVTVALGQSYALWQLLRARPGMVSPDAATPAYLGMQSHLYFFIYDQEQQTIVYYRASPRVSEYDPFDLDSLEKQFNTLLDPDFPPDRP